MTVCARRDLVNRRQMKSLVLTVLANCLGFRFVILRFFAGVFYMQRIWRNKWE